MGLRTALFWTRAYARILRTGLAHLGLDHRQLANSTLQSAFTRLEKTIDQLCSMAKLAA